MKTILLIPLLFCVSCGTVKRIEPPLPQEHIVKVEKPRMDDVTEEYEKKLRYKMGKPIAKVGDASFVLGAGFAVVAGVSLITFPLVVPGAVFMIVGAPPHYIGNAIAGTKPDYGQF